MTRGDGSPAHSDTPFFIASIDKLLVGVLVTRLLEEGRLQADAPICEYLGSATCRGLHRWRGGDYSEEITVDELLHHTTGLPDWLEEGGEGKVSVRHRLLREGDDAFDFERIISIVRRQTAHFPPQAVQDQSPKNRYSDTNYVLLAAIIERVLDRPLPAVLEETVFRPLGLNSTFVATAAAVADRAPVSLLADGRELRLPRFLESTRGIYSTCGDLARIMRSLVQRAPGVHPSTFLAMQDRWIRLPFPRDRTALRIPGWPIEYARGVMRFQLPKWLPPFHSTPAVIGHTGSTGSWLFHCPAIDMILCGNIGEVSAGAMPYRVVPKILRAVTTAKLT